MRNLVSKSSVVLVPMLVLFPSRADEILFSYEADVRPDDPAGGFILANACEAIRMCSDFAENGHFVIEWGSLGGDLVNYSREIARDPDPHPKTLWVEWKYSSNLPLLPGENGCDGRAFQQFREHSNQVDLHGDTAVSFDGGSAVAGIPPSTLYTLRYESEDGMHYNYAVDGVRFYAGFDNQPRIVSLIQFGGSGDCTRVPGTILRNEWDFVRYGTISDGEAVLSSDPPGGVVDANAFPNLDKFIVTFDQPGFVYIDDITIEILTTIGNKQSAVGSPTVLWVRRPDNAGPESVEIILDQPLLLGMTTRFTFNTGGSPNTVEYTYLPLGACCVADGSCVESVQEKCDSLGGAFVPGGSCPGRRACCLTDRSCVDLDPSCCEIRGGTPSEPDTNCENDADFDGLDGACGDDCPFDSEKTEPGQCGCGEPDTDSDLDTVADCVDVCEGEDDRIDEDNDGIPDCRQFQPIPTTTDWGLAILALLLAAAAKVGSIRRRAQP